MADTPAKVFCAECEDQEPEVRCTDCDELFCRPCFQQQHHKGTRAQHTMTVLLGEIMPQPLASAPPQPPAPVIAAPMESTAPASEAVPESSTTESTADAEAGGQSHLVRWATVVPTRIYRAIFSGSAEHTSEEKPVDRPLAQPSKVFAEKFANIPVRLTPRERALLQVLEGALTVSEYTDKVDVLYRWDKSKIVSDELDEVAHFVCGLQFSNDLKSGTALLAASSKKQDAFMKEIFEIGRRYKIMNPDKMRGTYGKLMYMLQDAVGDRRDYVGQIHTVESFLCQRGAGDLLKNPLLDAATTLITSVDPGEREAQLLLRQKATEAVLSEYVSEQLPAEDIALVLSSIADSHSYQLSGAAPVDTMRRYLQTYFGPSEQDSARSLRLSYGEDGSKLSHKHREQYTFVLQTLTLWHSITQEMFGLWMAADRDLLGRQEYRLWNTGQGLNRVQPCPNVSAAIHAILSRVQSACGAWVGLSVVHLGDRDVPNALMFIDKYTQIPRILGPIVSVLDRLDTLAADPSTAVIIEKHGGAARIRLDILQDFFKSAFNGDGDDGGSCIDGRLTSTWNWCSRLAKKSFYDIFLLSGFQGFDGSFKA
eukprot:m.22785 g.22785  ORF g.22785 m.22785 type:complete len:594 (-) comp3801_c0_seq1:1325-3106(-)